MAGLKKTYISIKNLSQFEDSEVYLRGWVCQYRSSGKIAFLLLRDGYGECQCVFSVNKSEKKSMELFSVLSLESSVEIYGKVKKWKQGYEISAYKLKILSPSKNYPIAKKSHGVDFLLNQRHLWLRSRKQRAILSIRSAVMRNIHDFFQKEDFVHLSAPILMPTASEGTSSLFPVEFFEEKQVFLSQSGQLYMEAGAAAFGKVYCFGPTFRAEKSSTRRHLLEFWMVEPEMAFYSLEDSICLAEKFVEFVVQNSLQNCSKHFETLKRDVAKLEKVKSPFFRLSYKEALETLKRKGVDLPYGKDLGAKEESLLSENFEKPVFIHHYPKNIKSFYMKEDPEDSSLSLSFDLLATEAYGELIGGSEREDKIEILVKNIEAHGLEKKHFEWYLDLRRYGSVPHSGFGLGLERMLSWLCGLDHVREVIPFPRLYGRSFFEKQA